MQVDKDAGLSCDMLSFNRICRLSCYVCPNGSCDIPPCLNIKLQYTPLHLSSCCDALIGLNGRSQFGLATYLGRNLHLRHALSAYANEQLT